MRAFMRDLSKADAQEALDKFTLKFYLKKPTPLFNNMDPKMAAEAERAAELMALDLRKKGG